MLASREYQSPELEYQNDEDVYMGKPHKLNYWRCQRCGAFNDGNGDGKDICGSGREKDPSYESFTVFVESADDKAKNGCNAGKMTWNKRDPVLQQADVNNEVHFFVDGGHSDRMQTHKTGLVHVVGGPVYTVNPASIRALFEAGVPSSTRLLRLEGKKNERATFADGGTVNNPSGFAFGHLSPTTLSSIVGGDGGDLGPEALRAAQEAYMAQLVPKTTEEAEPVEAPEPVEAEPAVEEAVASPAASQSMFDDLEDLLPSPSLLDQVMEETWSDLGPTKRLRDEEDVVEKRPRTDEELLAKLAEMNEPLLDSLDKGLVDDEEDNVGLVDDDEEDEEDEDEDEEDEDDEDEEWQGDSDDELDTFTAEDAVELQQMEEKEQAKRPEVARAYGLPLDILFPDDWDDLADTEKERFVNIYNNDKTLRSLGLKVRDMEYLVEPSKKKKALPKQRPTGTREQRAAQRDLEKKQRAALESQKRVDTLRVRLADKEAKAEAKKKEQAAKAAMREERATERKTEREAKKEATQARFSKEVLDAEYNKLWWSTSVPKRGRLPTLWTEIPSLLREKLQPRLDELRNPDKSSGFRYVDPQTNTTKKNGTEMDRGWMGQVYTEGKLWRVCLVCQPEVAALMCAAALLDTRIRSQKAAGSWLLHLTENPAAVERWVSEVDLTKSVAARVHSHVGAPKQTKGLHARRDKAILAGTFKPLGAATVTVPVPAAPPAGAPPAGAPPAGAPPAPPAGAPPAPPAGAPAQMDDATVFLRHHDGASARSLYEAGATYEQLHDVGYDITQLVDAVPLDVLVNKGVAPGDLVAQGVSLLRLAAAGVSRDDMLALGYPEEELGDFLNMDDV